MADIYNSPNGTGNSATPWIVGIVAIVVLVLLFMFFMPRSTTTTDTTRTDTGTPGNTNPVVLPAPVINNTTINATSTTVNSTSTRGTR